MSRILDSGCAVFVFGTGVASLRTTLYLKAQGYFVKSYLDNNPERWGVEFKSRPICPPSILEFQPNPVVFIASQDYRAIYRQLARMKIRGLIIRVPPLFVIFGIAWLVKFFVRVPYLWLYSPFHKLVVLPTQFHTVQRERLESLIRDGIVKGSNVDIINRVKSILESKNSSTAYIFGCGTSINNLSDEDFKHISIHLTVGLNGFIYHRLRTDLISFEFDDTSTPSRLRDELPFYFERVCSSSANQLAVFKDLHRLDETTLRLISQACPNLYASTIIYLNLFGRVSAKFYRSFFYKFISLIRRSRFKLAPFFFQRSNSLDYMIDLLIASGVKRIILAGVDLDDRGYFWENNCRYDSFHRGRKPEFSLSLKDVPYTLQSKKYNGASVREVIENLNKGDSFYGFEGIYLLEPVGSLAGIIRFQGRRVVAQ